MADIIVALDNHDADEALRVVERLGDSIGRYKVGSELFLRCGPGIIAALRQRGKRVFLDLKFHDIPNTVARAVEAAAAMGVEMLTLHVSGGAAMARAARAAVDGSGAAGDDDGRPLLIGVTLLTSFSAAEVEEAWGKELRSVREEVARLGKLAADAGMDGVVASPVEVEQLKRRHGDAFVVITPGIRPAGAGRDDQVRVGTPAAAVAAGSDFLVIGRPILQAADPAAAVEQIRAEMESAPEMAR